MITALTTGDVGIIGLQENENKKQAKTQSKKRKRHNTSTHVFSNAKHVFQLDFATLATTLARTITSSRGTRMRFEAPIKGLCKKNCQGISNKTERVSSFFIPYTFPHVQSAEHFSKCFPPLTLSVYVYV